MPIASPVRRPQPGFARTSVIVSTEATPKFDCEGLSWAMQVIIGGNLRSAVDFRLASLGRNMQQGDLERVTAEWYETGRKFTARDYARAITIVHGIGRRFGAFFAEV